MSHKKSGNECERNKGIWTINLARFQKTQRKRGAIPLEEKCRLLKKIQIVGRYQYLGTEIKGRKERKAQISKEITNL